MSATPSLLTAADAIRAFQVAGLPVSDRRVFPPDSASLLGAPPLATEVIQFTVEVREELVCRVFAFDDMSSLAQVKSFLERKPYLTVVTFENLVLQMVTRMPETQRRQYETALRSLVPLGSVGSRSARRSAATRASQVAKIGVMAVLVAGGAAVFRYLADDKGTDPAIRATSDTAKAPVSTVPPSPCSPARLPEAAPGPVSGTVLIPPPAGGHGRLRIDNGTDQDAAVMLLTRDLPGTPVVYMYVRAHEQAEVDGIPPGSHRLLFQQGKLWDSESRSFRCNRRGTEFVGGAEFTETTDSDGVHYAVLSFTLHAVPQGNAPTKPVDPGVIDSAVPG